MTFPEAMVLAILQGLTEFLPISSSAHLVLVPWLLGWSPHEIAFDTTLHLGTIAAVMLYFGKDLARLAKSWLLSLVHPRKRNNFEAKLAWWIIIATMPGAIIGYAFQTFFEALFAHPGWIALFLLVTAALLISCEKMGRWRVDVDSLSFFGALGVGVAQALAIAPGISRSGATISAGMLWGLRREAAARFSFLMSIPIIMGAGGLQFQKLLKPGASLTALTPYMVGFVLAAITGYLCIHFFLSYLRSNSLYPFAIYCASVGFGVLCYLALAE